MALSDAERAKAYRERKKLRVEDVDRFLDAFAVAMAAAGQERFCDDLFDMSSAEALRALTARIEGKRVIVASPKKR